MVNSFGHTAYDLARDQLASDEKTVLRDKSEVRAVLDAYDAARAVKPRPKVVEHADPLPEEGTAVALQLETVADAKARESRPRSVRATASSTGRVVTLTPTAPGFRFMPRRDLWDALRYGHSR